MSGESSGPAIYQLDLQPKDRLSGFGGHVETQYRWCERHNIAYSVRIDKSRREKKVPRKYGECPLCWRERVPPKVRRPPKQASTATPRLVVQWPPIEGTITTVTVQVGGEYR